MNKTTMTTTSNTGYLEIILGPMYSSKSTRLVEIYKQCKFCNISVSIINHTIDKRYHDTMLSTHDKVMVPCIQANKLSEIWLNDIITTNNSAVDNDSYTLLQNSDVILINEGQFFSDLYEVVVDMLNKNKKVYICGLDGDFERKKFGSVLDLIPLCDKVTKLTSLCSLCKDGTPGIFSMRLTKEREQTVVGSENYIPVCRKCYTNKC
jgi:thymidine kinase